MKDPATPAEWQDAVEWAETCLLLESAIAYGLVVGGPKVDGDRCVELLKRGAARGYVPTSAGVDARIAALARGGGSS
jgi:hypothetical protein